MKETDVKMKLTCKNNKDIIYKMYVEGKMISSDIKLEEVYQNSDIIKNEIMEVSKYSL